MNEQKERLLIVDGMALLFRSYFATAAMGNFFPNEAGVPTNAVQGFLRHVMTAEKLFSPQYLVVCWDMGAKTFRNDIYEGYKAHRPAPAPELVPQFDMTREASEQMGYYNTGFVNIEADDVIGSIVEKYSETYDITIVSGDKDLFQLLRPNVTIAIVKKGYSEYDLYTEERFTEEYGFSPEQYIDYKAFIGDNADGYPGVKGIGPKTATKLIQTYGSIEGVLANREELTKGVQTKLSADEEMLHISYKLAAIHCEVDIELKEEEMRVPKWTPHIAKAFQEAGYSLVLRYRDSLMK